MTLDEENTVPVCTIQEAILFWHMIDAPVGLNKLELYCVYFLK